VKQGELTTTSMPMHPPQRSIAEIVSLCRGQVLVVRAVCAHSQAGTHVEGAVHIALPEAGSVALPFLNVILAAESN
jgi:hypothetical protein